MTIKVKSSFIVLQMYFNSLTLCLFWKKIDTNAPIHSNNQKSWFYSFFWERDVVYCMYPLPHPKTSLNQVNSYWKLLVALKLLVEKIKESAVCSKRVFFRYSHKWRSFNFKTLPKKIGAPGKIFIWILQQAFKLPKMSVYISLAHSNGQAFSLWVGGLLVQKRMYKIWVQEMV